MNYTIDTDVLIAGAGPTGLVLANLLGTHGIRVTIVEKRADLIDYPAELALMTSPTGRCKRWACWMR